MAYSKRVALLLSMAAITAVGGALPASANVAASQDIASVLASETVNVSFEAPLDLPAANEKVAPAQTKAEPLAANVETSASLLQAPAVEATPVQASAPDSIEVALQNSTVQANPTIGSDLLAQSTSGAYQGVTPAYLGIGGNLGIGDNKSPLSDMGFAVISKLSLGPRFSLRPAALIAEKGVSFAIPVTYNFNTTSLGGFTFQPYLGAGADIPTTGSVGLLLSAGVDVPISRDFTINAATNFRVTDGFGLGILVGVGYSFPWFFE